MFNKGCICWWKESCCYQNARYNNKNPRHASSNTMLIFRRSNCIVTASGIVTLRRQLFSAPVESGRRSSRNRPEQAQGVPGRLRHRILLTFGTTRVVGRQPYAPGAFPQEKSLVIVFRGWVDPRAHGSVGATEKIPSHTTGNRSRDRPTSSSVLPQAPKYIEGFM